MHDIILGQNQDQWYMQIGELCAIIYRELKCQYLLYSFNVK